MLPQYRGQGIGKAILQHLARLAVDRGCGRMEWWCLDWNSPNIAFYRSLGARPMDEWTVYRLTGDTLRGRRVLLVLGLLALGYYLLWLTGFLGL